MVIAISARGVDLDAGVDVRFGRAATFVLVDTVAGTARALENREASGAGQGAGIQAAQLMAANGVHVVLTGHCGPNAYRALQAGRDQGLHRVGRRERSRSGRAIQRWSAARSNRGGCARTLVIRTSTGIKGRREGPCHVEIVRDRWELAR